MDTRGPQITARPGTKRHLAQTIARSKFFAILHISQRAETRRLQAKIDTLTTDFLSNNATSGNA